MGLVDYDEVFKLARWYDGRVPAVSPLVLALLIYQLNSVKNHLSFSHWYTSTLSEVGLCILNWNQTIVCCLLSQFPITKKGKKGVCALTKSVKSKVFPKSSYWWFWGLIRTEWKSFDKLHQRYMRTMGGLGSAMLPLIMVSGCLLLLGNLWFSRLASPL